MQTLAQALAQTMKNGISHTTNTAAQSSERTAKREAALERLKNELQCDEIRRTSWIEPRDGIDCPICNNSEIVYTVRDGKLTSRHCSCVQEREAVKRIRALGLEKQVQEYTFENYLTPQAWQKQAKQIAMQFVKNKNRQWILFAGQSGAGKTHLSMATATRLMRTIQTG